MENLEFELFKVLTHNRARKSAKLKMADKPIRDLMPPKWLRTDNTEVAVSNASNQDAFIYQQSLLFLLKT